MKPASFDYALATTLPMALDMLAQRGADARVIAGGQTLGPMLNLRLAMPSCLVDLGGIDLLRDIKTSGARIRIGAGVTHAKIEDGAVSGHLGAVLARVAGGIAFRAIRNRGTIGGSLAHADPAADWITVMRVLDAKLLILGPAGERVVPMRNYMTGAFSTAVGVGEILTGVEIAEISSEARWGYSRISRKVGEFPEALAAVLLEPDKGISRVVVGALDGAPVMLSQFAERLALEGVSCVRLDIIEAALSPIVPQLDAFNMRLHCAAVRRAALQAIS